MKIDFHFLSTQSAIRIKSMRMNIHIIVIFNHFYSGPKMYEYTNTFKYIDIHLYYNTFTKTSKNDVEAEKKFIIFSAFYLTSPHRPKLHNEIFLFYIHILATKSKVYLQLFFFLSASPGSSKETVIIQ